MDLATYLPAGWWASDRQRGDAVPVAGGAHRRHQWHRRWPAAGSRGDIAWRMWFLAGLFLSPALILMVRGSLPAIQATVSTPTVLVAGLLVGIGTRIGSGCTSGHGVCGLGRSPRSLAAVLTFIGTGMLTVWMMRHGAGGQP